MFSFHPPEILTSMYMWTLFTFDDERICPDIFLPVCLFVLQENAMRNHPENILKNLLERGVVLSHNMQQDTIIGIFVYLCLHDIVLLKQQYDISSVLMLDFIVFSFLSYPPRLRMREGSLFVLARGSTTAY